MKSLHLGRGLFGFIHNEVFYTYRCGDNGRNLKKSYSLSQESSQWGHEFVVNAPVYDVFPQSEFIRQPYAHYWRCHTLLYGEPEPNTPGVLAFRESESGDLVVFEHTFDLKSVQVPQSDIGHFAWRRKQIYKGQNSNSPIEIQSQLAECNVPMLWLAEDFWFPQHKDVWSDEL